VDVVGADRAALTAAIDAAAGGISDRLKAPSGRRLKAGRGLRRHGEATLENILRRIQRHQDELDEVELDARSVRVALGGLRLGLRLLRALDHALLLLERPTHELGLGALYVLVELADQLLDAEVDLLESPSGGPDFAVRSYPLSRLLQNANTNTEPIPVELLYPRREATTTILLAPLLVHELGHPVCVRHDLVNTLRQRLSQVPDWTAAIEGYRDAASVEGERPSLARTHDRLGALLEESLCDALATACLGPSYLLAFASWAGLDTREEWAESHPPTQLRMAQMIEQLEELAWDLGFFEDILDWIRGLGPILGGGPSIDTARTDALRAAAPMIRQVVDEHLVGRRCRLSPDDYKKQVAAGLEESFRQDVLPAQLDHEGAYADRRSILLAAWKHALSRARLAGLPDGAEPESAPRPTDLVAVILDEPTSSLLDKALEMSAVLERWREVAV
jgi:hypothetical protein